MHQASSIKHPISRTTELPPASLVRGEHTSIVTSTPALLHGRYSASHVLVPRPYEKSYIKPRFIASKLSAAVPVLDLCRNQQRHARKNTHTYVDKSFLHRLKKPTCQCSRNYSMPCWRTHTLLSTDKNDKKNRGHTKQHSHDKFPANGCFICAPAARLTTPRLHVLWTAPPAPPPLEILSSHASCTYTTQRGPVIAICV